MQREENYFVSYDSNLQSNFVLMQLKIYFAMHHSVVKNLQYFSILQAGRNKYPPSSLVIVINPSIYANIFKSIANFDIK